MSNYQPEKNRYDGRMKYRRCGRSGLLLPEISLGCWHNFGGASPTDLQRKMIYTAFDEGITHFDLANNYGPPFGSAESNVGQILKDLPRDELIISSKAGYNMWDGPYGEWGSRKYLLASLDQSLKRLQLDYVDIFYSHRFDPDTPLEETLGSLNTAIERGKALYCGVSSYTSDQTDEAVRICSENGWHRILIHQPNYSMFNRWVEKRLTATCQKNGMGMIAFCPLFQGLLTDKYLEDIPENSRVHYAPQSLRDEEMSSETINIVRGLAQIAARRSQTLAQMAIAWILRQDTITSVLCGASRAEQITENCRALDNITFSKDEIGEIDKLLNQVVLPPSNWAGEADA
ncbi:MAG: aldo/keto reductase [Mariniblastus sp.]|nr:aldo/keto reductase [Mariniblastus sp.]